MKIKRDTGAVALGTVVAAAAVALAAPTGGASLGALAIAGGGGALVGSKSERGRTTTSINEDIVQISSNLTFNNNLNIQSASDTTVTASNLKADTATILTGKFRDENTKVETVTNADAKLNINSAFDSHTSTTTVHQVKPNYAGVAVVAGVSAYVGAKATQELNATGFGKTSGITFSKYIPFIGGEAIIPVVVGVEYSSLISNGAKLVDPIFTLESKHTYHDSSSSEVKTNLNFNNLITK